MMGHRVTVIRENAPPFEGTLVKHDAIGVVVHKRDGFNDERLFIPFGRIIEIKDHGRAP